MPAIKDGVWVGAAAFAFGLWMAGPQAAGVASAEPTDPGSRSVSAGPAKQTRAETRPARKAGPARPAATARVRPAAAPGPSIRSQSEQATPRPAASISPAPAPLTGTATPGRRTAANPVTEFLAGATRPARRDAAPIGDGPAAATPPPAPTPPTINLHNNTGQTIWVYNLPNSGDYSIPSSFVPVEITDSTPVAVTLVPGTGPAGSPKNRIYIVEGPAGFALPVEATSGVDAFNPTAVTAGNSFLNYSFVEYYLYSAPDGSSQYTIDTSYIDEWSLPIQMQFTLNGANWNGAVNGRKYGFTDFDTVVSQLNAAGAPYGDLVWSGSTPYGPQPPATVSRIVGPDKVWTQQSLEPSTNVNMNQTGWVPTSYQNFVQYGSSKSGKKTIYPYAQDGTKYSSKGNFTFWKDEVTAPASTPYPIALRTAAKLDGFPADTNGVYGFFTYPNDEAGGQFTNIPTAVSLDLYIYGSSDGSSGSVIEGGEWAYSKPSGLLDCGPLAGTEATDTFILNHLFNAKLRTPEVKVVAGQQDIVGIDKGSLRGAKSNVVDLVDNARFWGRGKDASQFVYDTSTGYLYYDRNPALPGRTGVLSKLPPNLSDPANTVFVL